MEILRQDILSQQGGELNGLGQLDHVLSESKFLAIDSRILTWQVLSSDGLIKTNKEN